MCLSQIVHIYNSGLAVKETKSANRLYTKIVRPLEFCTRHFLFDLSYYQYLIQTR